MVLANDKPPKNKDNRILHVCMQWRGKKKIQGNMQVNKVMQIASETQERLCLYAAWEVFVYGNTNDVFRCCG